MPKIKCNIRIKDYKYNRIVGEIGNLKVSGPAMDDYVQAICNINIKALKIWDKEIKLSQLVENMGILFMDDQDQIAGEYICTFGQNMEIKENNNGTLNLKGKVTCSRMLTNRIIRLWNYWNSHFEKGIWVRWGKKRKKAWLNICRNHQEVREKYYQENIEWMQLERIYLDGTNITDRFDFSCALGEAFFGAGGYYGNSNDLSGYGYLHDQVALAQAPVIYWENFKRPQELFLAYYMEVMIDTGEAGAKLIVLPEKAADIKTGSSQKVLFLEGKGIKSSSDFFKTLSEAIYQGKCFTGEPGQLELWLKKRKIQGEQVIVIWDNYEYDQLPDVFIYLEFFIKLEIPVIFTHDPIEDVQILKMQSGIEDSSQKQISKKSNNIEENNYITAEEFEKIIEKSDSDLEEEYLDFKINIIERKKFIKSEDIYRLINALIDQYGRWPAENIIENVKMLINSILITNDFNECINELLKRYELFCNKLSKGYNQRLKTGITFEDEMLRIYSEILLQENKNNKRLVQIAQTFSGYSLQTILKFIDIVIGHIYIEDSKRYRLLHLFTQYHPKEIISFVIDHILNPREVYEIPIPTIMHIPGEKVRCYFEQADVRIRYLEDEGELYYNILYEKLKKNLYSVVLWHMYYRACLIKKQPGQGWLMKWIREQRMKNDNSIKNLDELKKITLIYEANFQQI